MIHRDGSTDQPAPGCRTHPRLRLAASCMLALGCLLPFDSVLAATTGGTNAPEPLGGKRYLFVLNTSSTMGKRLDGTLQAAENLLKTGFSRQMQRGDTIGVWTYNEQLRAGEFPLARWTPETFQSVGMRVLDFIKSRKFEKTARWETVVPALNRVVTNSQFLTVVLFTDGTEPIRGTPFDDKINSVFDQWKAEQQKAKMPFLTLLVAHRGKIVQYACTPAQWAVDLPKLPPDMLVIRTNPPATASGSGKSPATASTSARTPTNRVILPPLIVSGKKPVSTNAEGALAQPPPPAASADKPETPAPEPAAPSNAPVAPPPQPGPETAPDPPEPAPTAPAAAITLAEPVASGSTGSNWDFASPAEPAPPQAASTPGSAAGQGSSYPWMIGGLVGGILLFILALAVRRQRSTQTSLITHSIDRPEKK